jgi:hypothetical protein
MARHYTPDHGHRWSRPGYIEYNLREFLSLGGCHVRTAGTLFGSGKGPSGPLGYIQGGEPDGEPREKIQTKKTNKQYSKGMKNEKKKKKTSSSECVCVIRCLCFVQGFARLGPVLLS